VNACPRRPDVETLGAIRKDGEAIQTAEDILFIDQLLKQKRAHLRAWVDATSTVTVGDVRFDFWR
jgi:hypothetical protein